ncbi:MAG TPA: flagellar hook-associated protein FlgL [Homoserinimonas sp.]|nr:flagellar hook-associated protein FlgL [Homoserinimonas sp.]
MRVTHQTVMRAAQHNLQHSMSELAKLQERASSMDKISRPSDDPIGTADSMQVRAEQRQNEQYARNISNGTGWLASVDSALSTATDLIQHVRDLTVQGANDGSLSIAAKEAIAVELEGLREELLNTANTQYLGRTIFAGTADQGVAFNADLSFNGTGAGVERRIDAHTTVRVDVDGSEVFGTGTTSVFAVIDDTINDLRSGTNVGPRLTDLDTYLNGLLGQHGAMGARHAQILRAEETNMERSGSLEAQRSGIEDVDLGEVVLQLKLQEITYQSALAVTARVLQPTLMDFLR